MKIISLGVGEAFDKDLPNNSHLVISDKTTILLDCGYSIPQQFWKLEKNPDFLDAIYISHKHADHFFGLPILLMRMWEDKRTKRLEIICQEGLSDFLKTFTETAYKGFSEKFDYEIKFTGIQNGQNIKLNDLELTFAPTIHSIENMAIKVNDGNNSMCYSGDGQFIKETEELYKDSDLVIQETYLYDERRLGHASIKDAIEMAERQNIKCLFLTHMQRDFRKKELPSLINNLKSDKVKVIIPEPFGEYSL